MQLDYSAAYTAFPHMYVCVHTALQSPTLSSGQLLCGVWSVHSFHPTSGKDVIIHPQVYRSVSPEGLPVCYSIFIIPHHLHLS